MTTSVLRNRNIINVSTLVLKVNKTLSIWLARSASRKELINLSDHLLCDIGVTKSEARIEFNKPFWKE